MMTFFQKRLGKILIWQKLSGAWESDFNSFLNALHCVYFSYQVISIREITVLASLSSRLILLISTLKMWSLTKIVSSLENKSSSVTTLFVTNQLETKLNAITQVSIALLPFSWILCLLEQCFRIDTQKQLYHTCFDFLCQSEAELNRKGQI